MSTFHDFPRVRPSFWLWPVTALVLLTGAAMAGWLLVLAPDGDRLLLALALGTLLLMGALALVLGAVRQVRQAEQLRLTVQTRERCLLEAIDALPFGIAIYDERDCLTTFNRMAAELPPYADGEDVIGQSYEALIRRSLARGAIPDAQGREEEWLQSRMAARGKLSKPLLRPRPDGSWVHYYEISTPSGCLVMARMDVTELVQKSLALERSNEQLETLSATDGLTGLANRRMFDQHLYSEWLRSMRTRQPISLLLVDVDHFKRYNDHYGHLEGDACLRHVASILFDCAQRSGELVARYGGEEFAVLLPGTSSEEAITVAQRCMDELAEAAIPHADSPVAAHLTFSIGVATLVATQDLVPESLVRCADEALYEVKSDGRARYQVASGTA